MKSEKSKEGQGKRERWRTCIHEAGHVVMRWHLGMTPTKVEVYEAPNGQALGYTHGDGKRYGHFPFMAFTAGGKAAELRLKRATKIDRYLYYSRWLDAFRGTPTQTATSDLQYLAAFCLEDNDFADALECAYGIVNKNWRKVRQIAGLLEKQKIIEASETARLFAEWLNGGGEASERGERGANAGGRALKGGGDVEERR